MADGPAHRGTPHRVVVLGTGTGVGKTWVTCALAAGFREAGSAAALKPIETGYIKATSDSQAIARAADHADPRPLFQFELGVTPLIAAQASGVTLDLNAIPEWVSRCEKTICSTTLHVTLIESTGGVFSPLCGKATNFELAAQFPEACWLLVADNRLGVLHDVIATYEAMRARGRTPNAIVLNLHKPDLSSSTNAGVLRGMLPDAKIRELCSGDRQALQAMLQLAVAGAIR